MRWWVPGLLLVGGCDVLFGLSTVTPTDPVDAALQCGAGSAALNAAGCPCDTINAIQDCYLGDKGPKSLCRTGGVVTCQPNHVWSACAGATPPAQETCFDSTDNDCDGVVDNGCSCANGMNLCLGVDGMPFAQDRLIVVPSVVPANSAFTVFALSTVDVAGSSFQTDQTHCSSGPGSSVLCTLGGSCGNWHGAMFPLVASIGAGNLFAGSGPHGVKVWVHDNSPPCLTTTLPVPYKISGTVVVQ